jgi:Sulfotransferase family
MGFSETFDVYHQQAMAVTGLTDFGSDNYHQPLKLLLSDLDTYPEFNELGVTALGEQITGYLIGRLMKQAGIKQYPHCLDTPIRRPVFITGMARSGTTVLHRLLNRDPDTQSLPFWLGNLPMPRPPRASWEAIPAYQNLKHALEHSAFFTDQSLALHPIAIDKPDECRWSIDQSFWCTTIALTTIVPNYMDWILRGDATYAYQYHRELLSLVANGDRRRWILKDPSHLLGIDALLRVFPDACIVQTHRDPLESMRSAANLLWEGRRKMIEETVSEEEHGELVLAGFSSALEKMESCRKEHDPGRFYDVHISETRLDPVGTMERIYQYFELPVTAGAREAWQQQVSEDASMGQGTYPRHPEFGLTENQVNARLVQYLERYRQVCEQARTRLVA